MILIDIDMILIDIDMITYQRSENINATLESD